MCHNNIKGQKSRHKKSRKRFFYGALRTHRHRRMEKCWCIETKHRNWIQRGEGIVKNRRFRWIVRGNKRTWQIEKHFINWLIYRIWLRATMLRSKSSIWKGRDTNKEKMRRSREFNDVIGKKPDSIFLSVPFVSATQKIPSQKKRIPKTIKKRKQNRYNH